MSPFIKYHLSILYFLDSNEHIMESIYHIENDLDCRVLKFGIELCVSFAGEDCVIKLLKGRHKLKFQSLENEKDEYSIILEVPENDMEDFIEVQLIPIRNDRIKKEQIEYEAERARRQAVETARSEAERLKNERIEKENKERQVRLEAERLRIEERERREKEEKLKREEHECNLKRIEEQKQEIRNTIVSAISKASKFKEYMSAIAGYSYEGYSWEKQINFIENQGGPKEIIQYYLVRNSMPVNNMKFEEVNKFSDGLALVKQDGKYHFINCQGEIQFGGYNDATSFVNGIAFVSKSLRKIHMIDKTGKDIKVVEVICTFNKQRLFPHMFVEQVKQENGSYNISIYSLGEKMYTVNLSYGKNKCHMTESETRKRAWYPKRPSIPKFK